MFQNVILYYRFIRIPVNLILEISRRLIRKTSSYITTRTILHSGESFLYYIYYNDNEKIDI